MTYTLAELLVSERAYSEIRRRLLACTVDGETCSAVHEDFIDMNGLALTIEPREVFKTPLEITGKLDLRKIPQYTKRSTYHVDVSWDYLEDHIEHATSIDNHPLNLEPDFQRGHVWTEKQRIAYVEFCLRGGASGRELLFNCPGWNSDYRGPYEIVDGLQRLTSVRMFLRNELPIFGGRYLRDCDGFRRKDGSVRVLRQGFKWHVNDLSTRSEVLRWYLEINSGSTPHTSQELTRVHSLLMKEQLKEETRKDK